MNTLQIKQLSESATLPTRAHEHVQSVSNKTTEAVEEARSYK